MVKISDPVPYRSQGVEVGESFCRIHRSHVRSMCSTCSCKKDRAKKTQSDSPEKGDVGFLEVINLSDIGLILKQIVKFSMTMQSIQIYMNVID